MTILLILALIWALVLYPVFVYWRTRSEFQTLEAVGQSVLAGSVLTIFTVLISLTWEALK